MHRGLNKVMVIGRVEGDPEIRHTTGGQPVASFSVVTPRIRTTATGERFQEYDWINVVAWGRLADVCERELADEQQLFVEGRLQTRGWEDERGKQYYHTEVLAHEIIVLDGN
ncbi:MAG: single-stranded DNA-binding protein [Anaerolineae bacterium]|nr:single-stranded DNA-binding protein [Anaerolineae bacterium]MCO5193217.1 single-stranded DNA-binding protein [Anaerolineae bacterium]MCO5198161.1 single-stranded DNA-binding protein [Anaerolineae bacterium]MCO5205468.1 single-stranded DNA-binding protein [Anaerolineae bacterium]